MVAEHSSLRLPLYRLPLGWESRRGYRCWFGVDRGFHVLGFYQVSGRRLALPYCRRCGERRDGPLSACAAGACLGGCHGP